MNRISVEKTPSFKALLNQCLAVFNPAFTVAADGNSICLDGKSIIAKDTTVFPNGSLLNGLGESILCRVAFLNYEEEETSLVDKLSRGLSFAYSSTPLIPINIDFVTQAYSTLSTYEQTELLNATGYIETKKQFYDLLTRLIENAVQSKSVELTNHTTIQNWFHETIDLNFVDFIKCGLKGYRLKDYEQYFVMAQSKQVLTAFFTKYPHMMNMLRTIWEAHFGDPQRNIFGQLKTIEDMESGNFLVEKYNQPYNYYCYRDSAQKFLADAESWQWLLTQSQKTIDMVMKAYAVNDNEKKPFSYHSFGRVRENLSLIAQLKLDDKLANFVLKYLVSDSLEHDRFAIFVNNSEKELLKPKFHSGQSYRDNFSFIIAYMDNKGFDTATQIKFLKTFKGAVVRCISTHVWYEKDYKKSEQSKFEIVDGWVLSKLSQMKVITKTMYLPENFTPLAA